MSTDSVLPTRGDTCIWDVQSTRCPNDPITGFYGCIYDHTESASPSTDADALQDDLELMTWLGAVGDDAIPDDGIEGTAHDLTHTSQFVSSIDQDADVIEVENSSFSPALDPVFDILALAYETVVSDSLVSESVNESEVGSINNHTAIGGDVGSATHIDSRVLVEF